jgi:hypothetical protein
MFKDERDFDSPDSDESEDTEISEGYTQEDLEKFARSVEALLSKCANGQPWDEGEPVWLNDHTELNYVMDDADVPEDCREEVADLVSCPCCGNSFELWEDVGRKSEGELHYESLMAEWYENHEHRLDAFYEFLTTYPYLGTAHDFGKEIRKVISEFPSTTVSNDLFYRARRIESGREYSLEDFVPPDPAKCFVGEGRYNHAGQVVMYLSADKIGAAVECIRDGENRAWIHGFRISQIEKILDLTADEDWADENIQLLAFGLIHSGAVRRFADRSNSWKPEYFVPRFIADCAREKGFNGILFKSVRHWNSNLVLFNYDPATVLPEGDPEIVQIRDWKQYERQLKKFTAGPETRAGFQVPDRIDLGFTVDEI